MMKLIFLFLLFFLNFSVSQAKDKISDIIDYSYINTEKYKFNDVNGNILGYKVKLSFSKFLDGDETIDRLGRISSSTQNIIYNISVDKNKFSKEYRGIPSHGQKIISSFCIGKENNFFIITMLSYGNYDRINPWFIQFIPDVFEVKGDASIINREDLANQFNNGLDPYFDNRIVDEPNINKIYPYYSEAKILDRAYEIKMCHKDNINENALMQSTKQILRGKTYLYDTNLIITNMYLVKGDKINILNEKIDDNNQKWYFINYKGKKNINMWIKAEDVDLKEK
ncbi:hypothetical protein EDC44_1542 [Cricetibacter osteomyelitidis]|uniref:SH3 domain-containing protein n=1 Tax=Cricetibacter osteomyelitidis TaxID=1521931 RepID=A0A4R2SVG1_9PAST|nr:hypothetical protein [Cricetibacter osteomyelitidis]TCP88528.1 hypothetical protein EDC44_1542 [Cricetibacter osteomyelitidis]